MLIDPARATASRITAFRGFWLGLLVIGALAVLSARQPTLGGLLGGVLIAVAALYPAYVWIHNRSSAIPVFPLYASVLAVTHGLPLLVAPDVVMDYESDEQFQAAFTVALSITVGTLVWSFVRRIRRAPLTSYREIPPRAGDNFFVVMLGASAVLSTAMTAGWLLEVQEGLFSLVRAAVLACGALACLVLGYRHGRGFLTTPYLFIFQLLLAVNAVSFSASLLLNFAISYVLLAFVGFSLGRQKIPWLPVIVVATVFSVLHAGKADIRDHYWFGTESSYIAPSEYPSVYAEWVEAGLTNFGTLGDQSDSASLLNRTGLMYLLLRVQAMTPEYVPYMGGTSYAHIPGLLVPRLINADKPGAHEGTILLNIHFGLQTRESSATATIGWGLLNEAYANFGFLGTLGLFVVLGSALGFVERWSAGLPLLSLRALFSILLLSALITAEASLAVFIASLAQSAFVLLVASAFLMHTRRSPDVTDELSMKGGSLLPSSR